MLSVVPFVAGVFMNPELNRKRRAILFVHLFAFAVLACVPCALTGPLAPEQQIASREYIVIALGSISLMLVALHQMGRGVTAAYERIALELAERREELCDENEGRTRAVGATRCSGETIASVRRGTSIVAIAIDMKPNAP